MQSAEVYMVTVIITKQIGMTITFFTGKKIYEFTGTRNILGSKKHWTEASSNLIEKFNC